MRVSFGKRHSLPTNDEQVEANRGKLALYLVALNFNAPIFLGAPRSTGFPQALSEFLLFREADPRWVWNSQVCIRTDEFNLEDQFEQAYAPLAGANPATYQ
jgi:hypothetical protein